MDDHSVESGAVERNTPPWNQRLFPILAYPPPLLTLHKTITTLGLNVLVFSGDRFLTALSCLGS